MLPSNCNSTKGLSMGLAPGLWHMDPSTGIVSLTEEALNKLVNPEPIEKSYILDPDPIARGQWAVVYHCHHRVTGEEYAAKFSSRWRLGVDCTTDIEHEIAICAILRPTVRAVRLVDVFSTDAEVILVMEYAPSGDLQTLLDEDLVPYERNVVIFLKQLLEGLVFIHDRNIVHLDIKPQNLVLMGDFPDCSVKLCDFEISRMLSPGRDISQILGTADYVAPEIIHYEPITTKTDMWSFGVLTYVLLTGFLPFGGDSDQETFLEITKAELDFPEELFEDISEQAIDFIKRLLIRQPHLRMSARESLDHPWMKSDVKIPKIAPPQNLNLNFPINSSSPLSKSSSNATRSPQHSRKSHSSTVPSTPTSSQTSPLIGALNDFELSSLRNNNSFEYKPSRSYLSPTGTPIMMTPVNITPNGNTPVSASPRETGLPPLYPYMSSKSSQSTHSSTCSLNRGGSRQSLERLRSMSKSREVLFERLQMSSQRKVLSRSRERIFDGRYGLYRSRDQLSNSQLIFHSVETLPPYDLLNNDDSLDNSLTNLYTPMLPITSMMSMMEKNNNGHYKSMASIDHFNDHSYRSNNTCRNKHDSRFSINDEDYNSIVSQYNKSFSNLNNSRLSNVDTQGKTSKSYITEPPGREASPDRISKCNKTNHTGDKFHRFNREPMKSPSSPAVFHSETPKKSRKQSPEKEVSKKPKQKQTQNSKSVKETPNNTKTTERRRGSASHIEQRIQERHEKQARKAEKESKKKEISKQSAPKITKNERSPRKDPTPKRNRQNNNKKTQRTSNTKQSFTSSESSPCSSMESVKEVQKSKFIPPPKLSKTEANSSSYPHKVDGLIIKNVNKESLNNQVKDEMLPLNIIDRKNEVDEAYVSLEEPVDDGVFSRSDSMESNTSIASNSTIRASEQSSDTLEIILQDALLMEEITPSPKEQRPFPDTSKRVKISEPSLQDKATTKQLVKKFEAAMSKADPDIPDPLSVIAEEEEETLAASFARSISTCSDVSSVLSEMSEALSEEVWKFRKGSETPPEKTTRGRFYSIQGSSSTPIFPFKLSRSNSIHLDSPLTGKPRPWGELCNGAVGRACQLFSQKSTEFSLVGRKSSDPTSDRLPTTQAKNNRIEHFKSSAS